MFCVFMIKGMGGGGAGSRETDWNDLIDEDFDYISVFLFFLDVSVKTHISPLGKTPYDNDIAFEKNPVSYKI